jgi:hypothetical protein
MPDWLWIQNVVFPIIGMGMGGFVLYGIYRTVNRVLDRRHEARLAGGEPSAVVEEIEEVRRRLEQLEEQAFRIQEIEERLDFAERMLAQQTPPGQRPLLGGEH